MEVAFLSPKISKHDTLDLDVRLMDGSFRFVGDLHLWKENVDHIGWATYSRGYGYAEGMEQQRFNTLKADKINGHLALFSEFQQMQFRIMELSSADKDLIKWCNDPVSVRLSGRNCEQRYGYVWRWTAHGKCLWVASEPICVRSPGSLPFESSSPSQPGRPQHPTIASGQRSPKDTTPNRQQPMPTGLPITPQVGGAEVPFGLSVWAVVIENNSVETFFRESGISQIVTATSIAGRFFDTKDGGNALLDPNYEDEVLDCERNLRIIVDKRVDEKDGRVKIFVAPFFRYHELRLTLATTNVKVRRRCMFVMKGNDDVQVAEGILGKYCKITEVMQES